MTWLAWLGWRWVWWVAGAGLVLAPERGRGQVPAAEAVLVQMAAQAGVIFAGQVLEVRHEDAKGWVEIRFRVEVPVRGVKRVGSDEYLVREWVGLWTAGDRYRAGARYLMLLTPRSARGLSGPVDGMDGAIPLVPGGGEMAVDLRWLQAGVRRARALTAEPGGRQMGLMKAGVAPLETQATALSAVVKLLEVGGGGGAHEER